MSLDRILKRVFVVDVGIQNTVADGLEQIPGGPFFLFFCGWPFRINLLADVNLGN